MKSVLTKKEKETAVSLIQFVKNSPSMFHTVEQVCAKLRLAGAQECPENQEMKCTPGQTYYTVRNGSSVIAFSYPKENFRGFYLAAAHSDSPTFRIKANPEINAENAYAKLNVEKYGGMILSTWFDRPLSIAGRVAVKEQNQVVTHLVDIDRDLCVIPNLAIHMNPQINDGYKYNVQTDLLPIFAMGDSPMTKGMLCRLLAEEGKWDPEDILDYDLFLYVRDEGRIVGAGEEFLVCPKLDDLQSVYAITEGFLQAKAKDYCKVMAVFDNEEVGSGTKQGADSTFLRDTLERVWEVSGNQKGMKELLADSFLISADNGHAAHPNHPEKADPTNRPVLNGGPVIKYHGGQKYTSDAVSGGRFRLWCEQAKIPYQTYTNRSDIAGGSTLGNISTAHVSVCSVDIGFPQLAMHSCMETGGSKDTAYGVMLFKKYYSS